MIALLKTSTLNETKNFNMIILGVIDQNIGFYAVKIISFLKKENQAFKITVFFARFFRVNMIHIPIYFHHNITKPRWHVSVEINLPFV